MKSFLEEYGFAILAAIVVIVLIMMATPVGNAIKTSLQNVVNSFTNAADHGIGTMNTQMQEMIENAAQ